MPYLETRNYIAIKDCFLGSRSQKCAKWWQETVLPITSEAGKTALEGADALCSIVTAASGMGDVGLAEINLSKT